MQRTILLCLFVTFIKAGIAQPDAIRPLMIGDTVPPVPFQTFLKAHVPDVQLADLKGKLVILDFWNIQCVACLKGMPIMDSLQRQFKDQIQIIMITANTEAQVNNLFSKIKIKKPNLPMVIEDSLFYKMLFPHEGDPLHVWINTAGVVAAITNGHNATVSNINGMLASNKINVRSRASDTRFRTQATLLEVLADKTTGAAAAYSVYFNSLNQLTTTRRLSIISDPVSKEIIRVTAVNYPLLNLYSLAYSRTLFGYDINVQNLAHNNRIIVETKDLLALQKMIVDSLFDVWKDRNLVSYEAFASKEGGNDLLSIIQTDLERYTAFEARLEDREMQCYALQRTSKKDKIKTKNSTAEPVNNYSDVYAIINMPLSASLLPNLLVAYQATPYPVIDETAYTGSVDMSLKTALHDIKSLRKELAKYDLSFQLVKRRVKVLVIRDKKV